MTQRLAFAAKDGELDKVLPGAIEEARANDQRWPEYAVIHDGRIEPFEDWGPCHQRALSLGPTARLASRLTWTAHDLSRVYAGMREAEGICHGATIEDAIAMWDSNGAEPQRFWNLITGASMAPEQARERAGR